jgi:hypothetical protein
VRLLRRALLLQTLLLQTLLLPALSSWPAEFQFLLIQVQLWATQLRVLLSLR